MGFASVGGWAGGGEVGSLAGQDVTAKSFTATQASGSNAFIASTGARWKIGGGTTDYFTSDGSSTITSAGSMQIGAGVSLAASGGVGCGNITVSGGLIFASSSSNLMISGQVADGASAVATRIGTYGTSYVTQGSKLTSLINNSVEKGYWDAAQSVWNANGVQLASAASGGTIALGYNGDLRRGCFKITVAFGDWSAAALTKDITLGVIPAKARVVSCIADTTVAYVLGAGTIALTVGKTAGGAEYIASHDVKTAAVTKGLADADMGTALTRAAAIQGGDLPSWTTTTNFQARITSSSGNLSSLSAGSSTFYLTVEFM